MGANNSTSNTVKNIDNQLYISRSNLNILNSQLNQVISDTVSKSAMNSGGSIINTNVIIFKNISAEQDVIIDGVTSTQTAKFTFAAINTNTSRNDAATNFIQQTLLNFNNTLSLDVQKNMETNAESSIKTGFINQLPISSNKSSSDVINESNISALTTNNKNITNVLQNRVQNNFTTDTLTNCIANINNSNVFNFIDIKSNTASVRILNITQSQAATAIANCKGITDSTNNILNESLSAFGVKIDETNQIDTVTGIKNDIAQQLTNNSFIDSILNGFNNIFTMSVLLYFILFSVILFIAYLALKFIFSSINNDSTPLSKIILDTTNLSKKNFLEKSSQKIGSQKIGSQKIG